MPSSPSARKDAYAAAVVPLSGWLPAGMITVAPSAPGSVTSTSTSTVTPPTSSTSAEREGSSNTHDPGHVGAYGSGERSRRFLPARVRQRVGEGQLPETGYVDEDAPGAVKAPPLVRPASQPTRTAASAVSSAPVSEIKTLVRAAISVDVDDSPVGLSSPPMSARIPSTARTRSTMTAATIPPSWKYRRRWSCSARRAARRSERRDAPRGASLRGSPQSAPGRSRPSGADTSSSAESSAQSLCFWS